MFRVAVFLLTTAASVEGFSSTLFQEVPALKIMAPSVHDGVDVELPDFDELFGRIQQVSPLARQVISGPVPGQSGFAHIDNEKGKFIPSMRDGCVTRKRILFPRVPQQVSTLLFHAIRGVESQMEEGRSQQTTTCSPD